MSRGLTQAELGTKVGASQCVIAYYESHEAQHASLRYLCVIRLPGISDHDPPESVITMGRNMR